MHKAARFRFKFCILMTGILLVGGCQSASSVRESINRQIDAVRTPSQKPRAPVYNGNESYESADYDDPLQQHLRARRMVNPDDTSERHAYTRTVGDNEPSPLQDNMVTPAHKPSRGTPWRLWSKDKVEPEPAHQAVARVSTPPSKPQRTAALSAPEPAPAPVRKLSPSSGGHASVLGLRIGQHPGKTRIVLDVSASTPFTYHMEESKNVLVVELPDADWGADAKKVFNNHPLLLAYLAKPTSSGGTFLAIKMNKKSELVFKTTYPKSGASNFRIVFDVAPA